MNKIIIPKYIYIPNEILNIIFSYCSSDNSKIIKNEKLKFVKIEKIINNSIQEYNFIKQDYIKEDYKEKNIISFKTFWFYNKKITSKL